MKKIKRRLIIGVILVGLLLLFSNVLSKDLNRMNNSLKQENTQENTDNNIFFE